MSPKEPKQGNQNNRDEDEDIIEAASREARLEALRAEQDRMMQRRDQMRETMEEAQRKLDKLKDFIERNPNGPNDKGPMA